jgi:hypothetical protein
MEIATFKAMLERRGYVDVSFRQAEKRVTYTIEGLVESSRPLSTLLRTSYKGMRRQIDRDLGHGMVHSTHACGHPLLKAPAGYMCDDPFYRVEDPFRRVQFFAIPLMPDSQPLTQCPGCRKDLDKKDVHRVKDPESLE